LNCLKSSHKPVGRGLAPAERKKFETERNGGSKPPPYNDVCANMARMVAFGNDAPFGK